MKKINQNYTYLFLIFLLFSCEESKQITIHKVVGSPIYENSKLSLIDERKIDDEFTFSFLVDDYELGIQTNKEFDYNLANSAKGQHIHFIVDNGPYSAHYTDNFSKKLEEGNVVLAFLSRSYHESVKNNQAYVLTQIGDKNNIDISREFLFYSRPKGKYSGNDTKKLLLDFYLVNTNISSNGNKVRATINDVEFIIDDWSPYYIEGLPLGEVTIKLELIDSKGNLIETPFNPSLRTVILE